jgi:hypothetical protein
MRYSFLGIVLLLTGLAMAEMKSTPVPAPANDSISQPMGCFGHGNAKMGENWGPGFRQHPMGERRCERMGAFGNSGCCPAPFMMQHRPFHRMMHLKVVAGVMFLFALFLAAVNILLTVIVTLDMKKRAAFNGLWIPLLLIAGIPASIIYALFRMGDTIQKKA